ncbi:hypothetical protein THITH_01095 [Thioalkalivibrio paradoxus ARh 1]|uniref:Uncharacterized protein n=1 Tax=Thioalkalivibrio paradoxus ARh 1 TaxID=713585 RepID=W0DS72_9GAMM|nr:hypothetical protein THITH_01095 [Thioalkalivibrio paradoxus ARh 1]
MAGSITGLYWLILMLLCRVSVQPPVRILVAPRA